LGLIGYRQEELDWAGVYYEIRIRFNCKVSDKRDIEVIVEGKVGNEKRRVSDFSKNNGLQGLKSFYI
jgi:hypothetical protein